MKLIDFEKAKNEIIREIAESQDLQNVVRHICYKNGYSDHTKVIEDVKQEVIEKMLKKDAETIYNYYVDDPKRPFALALGIARKQFLKHPTLIGYNKQSFGEYISFTSNLKKNFSVIESDKSYKPNWQNTGESEEENDDSDNEHIIYYLMQFLEENEKEFLINEMDKSITKGKYSKEYKAEKERIFNKIRQIAKDQKIKLIF